MLTVIDRKSGLVSGAVQDGTSIPVRKKRTRIAASEGPKRRPAGHGLRTWDRHHPNACRDLVRDPLSAEEWDQLKSWQKHYGARAGTGVEARRCTICRHLVPLLRRRDSSTCSSACARKLRYRRRKISRQDDFDARTSMKTKEAKATKMAS